MSLTNKKRTLFAGFFSIAVIVVLASCGNDTGNGSTTEKTASSDSISALAADSSGASSIKAAAKKKKGKVTGMMAMNNTAKMEKDKEGVYSRAEKMPEYPGGEKALSQFVESNINYPQEAIDQDTEGTVNVSFVVNEKGKVVNPSVMGKSAGRSLDAEAVKVVEQMPAWKPGMVKGKPVKTRLSLPVTFKLSDV